MIDLTYWYLDEPVKKGKREISPDSEDPNQCWIQLDRVEKQRGTQFIMNAYAPGFHICFGTPTSGDVLKIVMEKKMAVAIEPEAPDPAAAVP